MIIFDEFKYAKELSDKKDIVKNIKGSDMMLLIKYYSNQNPKLGNAKIIRKVLEYCSGRIAGFTVEQYYDFVKKNVNTAMKSHIRENKPIQITKNELIKIREIDSDEIRRFLFVILCVAKYYHSNKCLKIENVKDDVSLVDNKVLYLKKCSYQDLFKLAKIKYSIEKKNKFIYYLNSNGYIYTMSNQSVKILFAEFEGESVLEFKCYDDLVYELDFYLGLDEKLMRCEMCSEIFKRKEKDMCSKYCKKCAKAIKNEQNKSYIRKS